MRPALCLRVSSSWVLDKRLIHQDDSFGSCPFGKANIPPQQKI
jgi:hypothetical protein